uniref:39S ribosomal protein L23, mitochondrial n=1 Tax=Chrysemys picta bellii TaxID=8478 RepID=A0A8C3FPI6_CHRPI
GQVLFNIFINYLEKRVPVVRTRIQYGANNKRTHKNQKVKKPDYKVAYVQLGQGQTFQFPNLFPEKEETQTLRQRQTANPRRGGVTDCLGL